jgi:hypothetical protein
MPIILTVIIIIGISQGLVTINGLTNGKKCIEYNKNLFGYQSSRAGCKTWA